LYRGAPYTLERDLDTRRRFSVTVRAAKPFSVAELLSHLVGERTRVSASDL